MYCVLNLAQLLVVVGMNMVLLPRIGSIGSALALITNDALGLACMGMLTRWKLAQHKEH